MHAWRARLASLCSKSEHRQCHARMESTDGAVSDLAGTYEGAALKYDVSFLPILIIVEALLFDFGSVIACGCFISTAR